MERYGKGKEWRERRIEKKKKRKGNLLHYLWGIDAYSCRAVARKFRNNAAIAEIWPRNVVPFDFDLSLSSARYLSMTHFLAADVSREGLKFHP